MKFEIEPQLIATAITDLRPTQLTVGMREVEAKRKRWREESAGRNALFLGGHAVPVVLGPKNRPYLVDHHHLALALHLEGERHVLTTQLADLSRLDKQAFWTFLDNRGWMHPFDAEGLRRGYGHIPRSISDLVDDPYRSLAGALRLAGGYAKTEMPFAEFLWADHLRRRIKRTTVEGAFGKALKRALVEAKKSDAEHLPGWCGAEA
ncbi:ParB-like protein [Bosea rubneri]|uniref:ParB-like protein n=1 Tax=Bosea rubneri TaxID=3075434 RepID=A0ABU3SD93_9HYPH|nr:ParB-like protein [Bosea sp. ZW T0_25]MDU0342768.1 ParB-like protein [Bosea sp. ZW T0_25]